jgi:hypothetical protein
MRISQMEFRRLRGGAAPVVEHEDRREYENMTAEAWRVLDVTSRWISHADAKAGVILAACGIVAGGLFSVVESGGYGHRGWVDAAAIVCAVLLAASAAGSSLALWPRRGPDVAPYSLIYFDHVARQTRYSPSDYVEALAGLLRDPESLVEQIGMQVWAVSRAASAKYTWVDRSLFAFLAALFSLGLTMLAAAAF